MNKVLKSDVRESREVREVSRDEYNRLVQDDRVRRGMVGFVIKGLPLLAAFWLGWQALVSQGLESIVSMLIAGAVVAIIYVLLGGIEKHIYEGGSLSTALKFALPVIVLIMVSVAANLTVVYRKFAGPAVLQEEIDAKRSQLGSVKATLLTSLNDDAILKKRAEVGSLLDKMVSELDSPGKPGHGPLVEANLRKIEEALGVSLNRHNGAALSGPDALLILERRYRQDVSVQLEKIPLIASKKPRFDFIRQATEGIEKFGPQLDSAQAALRGRAANAESTANSALSQAAVLLESTVVGAAASGIQLNEFDRKVEFKNEGYGTIQHTLQSVADHLDRPITWLCLGLALAIDLSALLLVLVITEPRSALLPGIMVRPDTPGPQSGDPLGGNTGRVATNGNADGLPAGSAGPDQEQTEQRKGRTSPKAPLPGHLPELRY